MNGDFYPNAFGAEMGGNSHYRKASLPTKKLKAGPRLSRGTGLIAREKAFDSGMALIGRFRERRLARDLGSIPMIVLRLGSPHQTSWTFRFCWGS